MLPRPEAARVFDRIAHGREPISEVFFESASDERSVPCPWAPVATPGSATPPEMLHRGDLIVQRALGEGWLASTAVLGEDVEPASLYGPDGLMRDDTLVLRSVRGSLTERAEPVAVPSTTSTRQEIKAQPSLQILGRGRTSLTGTRWMVLQNNVVFQGTLDADGSTGPIDRAAGKFDPAQPFRLHVDGCVCSIVSGAALVIQDSSVEYGGQFLDWHLATDSDFQKSSAFWDQYAKVRTLDGPLSVFRFLQHDHVMRRPVRMLPRQTRAVFEASPLAIRLGPVVRYTDARRALIWLELETPGLVRVTVGKAPNQTSFPSATDVPGTSTHRHATTVRVGGRHYAMVWLEGLDADTVYQYTVVLAPQLPGAMPAAAADFTDALFGRGPGAAAASAGGLDLKGASFANASSDWLFFRTPPARSQGLRFAHGSCRKYPGDRDLNNADPGPDMLAAFGDNWLGKKTWAEWPRFFLHSGDQIYADDVGAAMAGTLIRHRVAAVVPGPAPKSAKDVAFGAWAGRFGFRYSTQVSPAVRTDVDRLRTLRAQFPQPKGAELDFAIAQAVRARAQVDYAKKQKPLAVQLGLRVLNGLLWEVPITTAEVPRVDKQTGLLSGATYRATNPDRTFDIEYPGAGDTQGVHAADFAEYATLYEQAWSVPGARRVLAHVPSFMIFDDHEVTDDWNADKEWLAVVHSAKDALRYWPNTITDALCAYWIYQGWGNLAPEQWAADPRVQILERCRVDGRDALPDLRRLVARLGLETPGADFSAKLDWNFEVPTGDIPLLVVDLRTDRDATGSGGMTAKRLAWMERALLKSTSPVAFIVLPVPYLMPDPMLFAFRNTGLVATLAGARATAAFRRSADLEHPAGNPVWDQIKGLLERLQPSSSLKTLVVVSGDIHFSCNLDGQIKGSHRPPRMLQLVSSGLRQRISDEKQGQLIDAYRGILLNAVSGAQGFDEHRGIRITVGGLTDPDGKNRNFLFQTSLAVVDAKVVPYGPASKQTQVPLVQQTHLVSNAKGDVVGYNFRHMTQPGGKAFMSLHNPGFTHPDPNYPLDYPRSTHGLGVTREQSEDVSSLEPGQSLLIDGQQVRTYADAATWYTARALMLTGQRNAFVKDQYPVPDGLDDLVTSAAARSQTFSAMGARPVRDAHVEEMLTWLDRYVEVLRTCDSKMELIAADRFRAARQAIENYKAQIARLQPRLRDLQRSAFRADKTSKLREIAETSATILDSVMVADKWVLDAATRMEDIRVLGTTLRAQKALHGSTVSWTDVMRKTTDSRVAKLISVAEGLNKVLAAEQLVDSGLTLLSGGKTASDTGSAGVSFSVTLASAGGTLLGASGFFSLYTNLYLGPMVKHILGQIDELKDLISTGQNHPYIQLGKLDLVNWDLEPGGREMYEFMHRFMKVRSADEITSIPPAVQSYFKKQRKDFDAGTPKRRGIKLNYDDFDDKRYWVHSFRDDIWGMLYGSMPVP